MVRRLVCAFATALAVACGSSCPREGCDALRSRASGNVAGIGGVVAYESDVVENGCAECGFGDATIEVYALSAPVTSDAEASAVVRDASPLTSIEASRRYSAPLEPGEYLVCVHTNCIDVRVATGAVTTVNVKLRYGPASFFVVDAFAGGFVEDFGFDVSAAMQ